MFLHRIGQNLIMFSMVERCNSFVNKLFISGEADKKNSVLTNIYLNISLYFVMVICKA